jgi:predicted RNA-binding protein
MCDIDVYFLKNGTEEKIMENVDRVERIDETGLKIQNIFGESRMLRGRMFFYDNSSKKMVFEPE